MKFLKYFLIFTAVYYVSHIAIQVVFELIGMDGSGGSIVAVLAGGVTAGRSFVADHDRLPTKRERWRLTLGSLACCVAISIVLTAIVVALVPDFREVIDQLVARLSVIGLAIVIGVVVLVYLGATYFAFGYLLSRTMRDRLSESADGSERKEQRLS